MRHDELDPKCIIFHLSNLDRYLPAAFIFWPGAIRARVAERRLAAVVSEPDLEKISFKLDSLVETMSDISVEGEIGSCRCSAITSRNLVSSVTHV